METKYTRHFVVSAVSALAAGLLFIFRQNYLESLKYVEGGLRLLLFHSYTPYAYLVPISAFIVIFGLLGSIKARIVFMGILFEFLYFLIDISIFCFYWGEPVGTIYYVKPIPVINYLSMDSFQYMFDPLIIAGTILVIISLVTCYRSIGIKATRPTFSEKVPARTTAVILILLISIMWSVFCPYSIRYMIENHAYISYGVIIHDPTLHKMVDNYVLIIISRVGLISIYSIAAIMILLRRRDYILAPAFLLFYAIRWFEMSPALYHINNNQRFFERIISDSMVPQKAIYPFSIFFRFFLEMMEISRFTRLIPAFVSLFLAGVLLFHLKEGNDRVIMKKIREFFKALFPYLFSKASI